jgi:hypothetical protein
MKFTKEENGRKWTFGKGKLVRLTFIKSLARKIDDIIISQGAFIERLKNFDFEFGMKKN